MSCFSDLTYAMYADGELSAQETQEVERHLTACQRCRELVAALREENRALTAALTEVEREMAVTPRNPAWRLAAAWTGLTVIAGVAILHATRAWVAPVSPRLDWWDLLFDVAFFLAWNAGTLSSTVAVVALVTMALLTIGGAAFLVRRPAQATLSLLSLLAVLGLPASADALETRAGAHVTVARGETVPGTLVAAGGTVEVDGTVDGDLIVGARVLEIRGIVKGDLIFAGRDVDIRGIVEGNAYTLAGALRVQGRVTRSLYGFNRATTVEPDARVDADVNLAGRSLELDGAVGRGVWVFGRTAQVKGVVGRDLRVVGHRLEVRAPARIGGTVTARVRAESDVHIDPDVAIGGTRDVRLAPPGARLYAEPRFYFWVATNLFGALVLGVVALALVPSFFHGSAEAVGAWWRSLGLGLAVLVGGPIAMVLAAVTLVGLPLALISLAVYLLGLYVAQIAVGAFLGRALLRQTRTTTRDSLLALLVGLLILTVAFKLPFVGAVVRFVVLCLGLGAFSYQLYRTARLRPAS